MDPSRACITGSPAEGSTLAARDWLRNTGSTPSVSRSRATITYTVSSMVRSEYVRRSATAVLRTQGCLSNAMLDEVDIRCFLLGT